MKIALQAGWLSPRNFKLLGNFWYFPNPQSYYADISGRVSFEDYNFFFGFLLSTQSEFKYHTVGGLVGWDLDNWVGNYNDTIMSISISYPFASPIKVNRVNIDIRFTFNWESPS